MWWVYDHEKYISSYSAGIDFSRQNVIQLLTLTESGLCRRQILMSKVNPRTVKSTNIYNGRWPIT